jgi:hypothetical protein
MADWNARVLWWTELEAVPEWLATELRSWLKEHEELKARNEELVTLVCDCAQQISPCSQKLVDRVDEVWRERHGNPGAEHPRPSQEVRSSS